MSGVHACAPSNGTHPPVVAAACCLGAGEVAAAALLIVFYAHLFHIFGVGTPACLSQGAVHYQWYHCRVVEGDACVAWGAEARAESCREESGTDEGVKFGLGPFSYIFPSVSISTPRRLTFAQH